jgi:hypothetical protein
MKTYQLKSVVRRGSMLGAVFAIAIASFLPAVSTYADALNPLTERSLTLSSSSPGWSYLDASGNATFAPPNSGANGNQAGNTFSFRVSSDADIRGLSFQYCTTPAGACMGPGNNTVTGTAPTITARAVNGPTEYAQKHSDLEIVSVTTPGEVSTYLTKFNATTGQPAGSGLSNPFWDSNVVHPNLPDRDGSEGNFIVLHKATLGASWAQSEGWAMDTDVKQTDLDGEPGVLGDGTTSQKANYITLTNATPASLDLAPGDYVKVIFFATDDNYIINPGNREFFVKINTFNTDDAGDFDTSDTSTTIIDGGVTVANVMNRSIEIQTKVLETMDFSVGTVDPNTLASTGSAGSQFEIATGKNQHGPCDPVVQGMDLDTASNVLKLGNEAGEFSLRTDTTYSTHSYWRLSSNSSGGATVYYSGVTLSNTVGDQINAIGTTASAPVEGSEQFGLAIDNATTGDRDVSYAKERTGADLFQNGEDNAVTGIHATTTAAVGANPSYHTPHLAPLAPLTGYAAGTGIVNTEYGTVNTQFAFDPESTVVPTPFASGTEVLDCATGKMRYIANIAATTPAGIYTTKINYIAAPKY